MAIRDIAITNLNKRKPQYKIEGLHGYENQAQAMQYVFDYDFETYNRAKELLLNDYVCAEFGTSVLYTGFNIEKRIIYDPIREKNGDRIDGKYKKKMETTGKVELQNFDIRRFFLDDQATCMEDAQDCIAIQLISEGAFQSWRMKGDTAGYKNINDDLKATENWFNQWQMLTFTTDDERGKIYDPFILLYHYYNKATDTYFVVANENTLIYEGHIDNAKHELPFTVRQFFTRTNQIYGRGLYEILLPYVDKLNKTFEVMIDAIMRSNQQSIAIGGNLKFDGQTYAYANNFLKFTGDFNPSNFQQLT